MREWTMDAVVESNEKLVIYPLESYVCIPHIA